MTQSLAANSTIQSRENRRRDRRVNRGESPEIRDGETKEIYTGTGGKEPGECVYSHHKGQNLSAPRKVFLIFDQKGRWEWRGRGRNKRVQQLFYVWNRENETFDQGGKRWVFGEGRISGFIDSRLGG